MYTIIDGGCFKNMLIGAYQMFEQKYEILNQLNVFPVPDGQSDQILKPTSEYQTVTISLIDKIDKFKGLPQKLFMRQSLYFF